jgi:hypothetical protein
LGPDAAFARQSLLHFAQMMRPTVAIRVAKAAIAPASHPGKKPIDNRSDV